MSDPTPSSQERAVSAVRRPSAGEAATPDDLVERVSSLVLEARESIASYANATLTLTYWQVGALIDSEVLGGERAGYGSQILASLAHELTARFGRGFERTHLRTERSRVGEECGSTWRSGGVEEHSKKK